MVEEGRAGFQANGHGGTVHFHQDVVRQVTEGVPGHHAGDGVAGEASGQGLIDGREWQLRGLALQQLGWITPFTHQRAVEIVTAAHIPQTGGELVGLVAQLANRQRLAQGIPQG
ncbi:MAG: hypothetical protein K9J75_00355 [Cyanobium usitatum Tobar12.5m-G36]|nr:hypothetical protein [Cyanobium usitatum Tobar12.5m-G36]